MPFVGFDRQSANRIAAAVKKVEGLTPTQPRPGRGRPNQLIVKRGKLDGTLSYGSSATMSVWQRSGSSQSDSGDNITVYDWLLSSGQSIASGTKVVAMFCRDLDQPRWYIVAAECS